MAASKEHFDTIVRPVQTEKSANGIAKSVYTFEVAKKSNKFTIKSAVEAIWDVKVKHVRVSNTKGEQRRNKHGRFNTKSYRKALVTLQAGFEIEIL